MPQLPLGMLLGRRSAPLFVPILAACLAVSASIAQTLGSGGGTPLLAETSFQAALPGRTLLRVPPGEMHRIAALYASQGRLLTGPALAALLSGAPAGPDATPAIPATPAAHAAPCRQPDSLQRRRCLDSLSQAHPPRALRELEARRDSLSRARQAGASGESDTRDEADSASAKADALRKSLSAEAAGEDADLDPNSVQEQRNRGYVTQFVADLGHGGDWDWDMDEWAVVIYVVVGVVVVGAFVVWGGKALYDLLVNKEESPVFREAGLQFSYSGRSWHDPDGAALFRDAWLLGGRFAIGVEKPYLSLGLAVEGGSIDLSVRSLETSREIVAARGGYLLGGPLVRFGKYRPLAFTMEFLNGTSSHSTIGWISKSRMTLAAKARGGFVYGAHLGAVFYDLRFTDGLVFRRGDFNRDLSLVFGLEAGYSF